MVVRHMTAPRCLAVAFALLLPLSPTAAFEAGDGVRWPDTFQARLTALALVQTLNAELLSNASATLTLDRWCATHRMAPPPAKIVAERVRGQDKVPDARVRDLLKAGPDEPIRYRRVRLNCGQHVLSEADNWYLPAQLTDAMNRQLDDTDIPFGRVVQALNFQRRTLSAKLLWQPLPEQWEMNSAPAAAPDTPLAVSPALLEHRAVLTVPNGTPFSALVETYTSEVLAFPWIERR
jgi:chorismate-pyruvate lyase